MLWLNTGKQIHTRTVFEDQPNFRFGDYEFVKPSHMRMLEQPVVMNFTNKLRIVLRCSFKHDLRDVSSQGERARKRDLTLDLVNLWTAR
jgi:hypothetical protein